MEIEFVKNRSLLTCLREALHLEKSNFSIFFKKTWIAALVFSLFYAAAIVLRTPNMALAQWGLKNIMISFVIQTIAYAGVYIVFLTLLATIFKLLTKQKPVRVYVRTFIIFILKDILFILCLVGLVIGFASIRSMLVKSEISTQLVICAFYIILGLVILMVIFLPFIYVIGKYILDEKAKLIHVFGNIGVGLRHFGLLFGATFIVCILLIIISALLYLPQTILTIAQSKSQLGAFEGDPLGTPAYFNALYYATAAITAFLSCALTLYLVITTAYLYGSIAAQEIERKQITVYEKD